MPVPLLTVDAFTDTPFRGNPAAVCWLDAPRDAGWMQAVAAEMNLSETAFVSPQEEGFSLRWFTPAVEVPLCGHATLASAHALWSTGRAPADAPIHFETASGRLRADRRGEWIRLDFPRYGLGEAGVPDEVLGAVGVTAEEAVRLLPEAGHEPLYVVRLADEAAVRAARPDFGALRATGAAVSITAEGSDADVDFVSRFFVPSSGIDEDPVTGAAHCWLAPFWAPRLGRERFVAKQVSAREGVVRVALVGDRVELEGRAVTVIEGALHA